jgi:hypothetical protein
LQAKETLVDTIEPDEEDRPPKDEEDDMPVLEEQGDEPVEIVKP